MFTPEDFILDFKLSHIILKSCRVKITIQTRQKNRLFWKKLLSETDSVISLQSEVIIFSYSIFFSDNRDILFYLVSQPNLNYFVYFIDYNTLKISVKNNSDHSFNLFHSHRQDYSMKICYNNTFFAKVMSEL